MASDIGLEFLERTKYSHLGRSDQQTGRPQPPVAKPPDPARPLLDLPDPRLAPLRTPELTRAIAERSSVRKYSPEPLTLTELSYLLWCTQGVREVLGERTTLRTVPSAGARHPLETYVLANRVEDLEPGLYHYLPIGHQLQPRDLGAEAAEWVHEATFGQYVLASAATFIWSATPYRAVWRYQARAWRYIFLDAGHACQNLYLGVEAIGAGCCAIAAYDDDAINRALGLDGVDEFVIYLATVGRR